MKHFFALLALIGSLAWADSQPVHPPGVSAGCGPYLRLVMTKVETSIGGAPARILGGGYNNEGILAAEDQGQPVVYKILKLTPERFESERRGVLLGAKYGGPKLLRSGPASRGRPGTQWRYYMELEHLFPHDQAITAKSLRHQLAPILPRQMFLEISQSLVKMMEDGVVPYDVDIIFTKEGKWRWIDTNDWQRGPLNSLIYQTMEIAYLLGSTNVGTFREVFLETMRPDHPYQAEAFERAFHGIIETLTRPN